MMEIIKSGTKINFTGAKNQFFAFSLVIMAVCIFFVVNKGFNLGIDFAGGTVIQVRFANPVPLDDIREGLKPVINGDFAIQNFGEPNEVLVRIVEHGGIGLQELSDNIKAQLEMKFAGESPAIQRIEQVGPQVGEDLRRKAFLAIIYSTIGILAYVAFRFELLFAIGAILSLIHDIVITLGFYSIAGKEFNLTVMAAVLTVAGYSLNDTIVIFDRIREKIKTGKLNEHTWQEITNMSINETLSRTVLTSALTFIAVLCLYIFGGEVINGFALVMMAGIVIGTYSSIGIAAMFVYVVRSRKGVQFNESPRKRTGGLKKA
ncbi:MAG: protein translocase subunit SecF [Deferribacteraceae bacterium]|jgi:preprotein translocase subunit SecF|nr:protein translocase subunit SecF [Deferribacteraceae bacterium]